MPYYKGKQFKVNVYTLINTHWTDRFGNQTPSNAVDPLDQYLDLSLKGLIDYSVENGNTNCLPYKVVPGFIPDRNDTVNLFVAPSEVNDPLRFNTTFCCAVPTAAQNAPQSRKGTKVTLSSIYITGSITKPCIPLPAPTTNPQDNASLQKQFKDIINNQVTYYLIYQQCKNLNEGPPDWRTIFYLNGSNRVCPQTYGVGGLGNRPNATTGPAPPAVPLGYSRFTHPQMFLNVDNREKFVILSHYTMDLDSPNTQFNFTLYEKLKAANPMGNSKKKNPIQTIYSNRAGVDNTVTNVEGGAVYLVRACYGVFNTVLVAAGGKTETGTTQTLTPGSIANVANNSYLDARKLYPSESFIMKLNYYDV